MWLNKKLNYGVDMTPKQSPIQVKVFTKGLTDQSCFDIYESQQFFYLILVDCYMTYGFKEHVNSKDCQHQEVNFEKNLYTVNFKD